MPMIRASGRKRERHGTYLLVGILRPKHRDLHGGTLYGKSSRVPPECPVSSGKLLYEDLVIRKTSLA
jgi:hypothetical protein